MWVLYVLLCSSGVGVAECTPRTALEQVTIHDVYGLPETGTSCEARERAMKARKIPPGLFLKFECDPAGDGA